MSGSEVSGSQVYRTSDTTFRDEKVVTAERGSWRLLCPVPTGSGPVCPVTGRVGQTGRSGAGVGLREEVVPVE